MLTEKKVYLEPKTWVVAAQAAALLAGSNKQETTNAIVITDSNSQTSKKDQLGLASGGSGWTLESKGHSAWDEWDE